MLTRSRCIGCGKALGPLDLVPVFTWLLRRGRCACRQIVVPWRYPALEIGCAAILLALWARLGLGVPWLLAVAALLALLLAGLCWRSAGMVPVLVGAAAAASGMVPWWLGLSDPVVPLGATATAAMGAGIGLGFGVFLARLRQPGVLLALLGCGAWAGVSGAMLLILAMRGSLWVIPNESTTESNGAAQARSTLVAALFSCLILLRFLL